MAKDEGTGFETHTGGTVADWEGRVALLIEKSAASHIAPLLQGPARGPCWLPRRTYAAVISQFFHGEVAAARLCRRNGVNLVTLADHAGDISKWMAGLIWRAIVRFRKPKRPASRHSAGISIAPVGRRSPSPVW